MKIFKCDSTPSDAQRIRQRVKKDYEQTVQIHQAMSRWPGLAAVRPVGYSLELLASVTEEAPGETLLAHLQSKAVWLATERHSNEPQDTMKRVGSWLRAFQSIGPRTGHVSVDSLRAYIDVRLERLTTLPAAHFNADDRRHVLAHLDRLSAIADPIDLEEVPVHRDLAPGNILVSPDCVTVLDFAMTGTGSRLHDLTRLFVQVELVGLKPQFSKAVLHRATRGLLEGFDEGLTTQRPMFRLLSLLHRVNHLATLSKSRAPFPASAYNWHVRRAHRSWIERELRMSERGA
ncbi:MAG TPA: phosphotransferase [Vicinamibacterales bacterium]